MPVHDKKIAVLFGIFIIGISSFALTNSAQASTLVTRYDEGLGRYITEEVPAAPNDYDIMKRDIRRDAPLPTSAAIKPQKKDYAVTKNPAKEVRVKDSPLTTSLSSSGASHSRSNSPALTGSTSPPVTAQPTNDYEQLRLIEMRQAEQRMIEKKLIEQRQAEKLREAEFAKQKELQRQQEVLRQAEIQKQIEHERQAAIQSQLEQQLQMELSRQLEMQKAEEQRQLELRRKAELDQKMNQTTQQSDAPYQHSDAPYPQGDGPYPRGDGPYPQGQPITTDRTIFPESQCSALRKGFRSMTQYARDNTGSSYYNSMLIELKNEEMFIAAHCRGGAG